MVKAAVEFIVVVVGTGMATILALDLVAGMVLNDVKVQRHLVAKPLGAKKTPKRQRVIDTGRGHTGRRIASASP